MLRFFCLIFAVVVVAGCSGAPTSPQGPQPLPPDNGIVELKQSPVLIPEAREEDEDRVQELRSEIRLLKQHISDLDKMIESSRSQMNGYRTINSPNAESLAEKAQEDLYVYEVQRTRLVGKLAPLEAELKERRP